MTASPRPSLDDLDASLPLGPRRRQESHLAERLGGIAGVRLTSPRAWDTRSGEESPLLDCIAAQRVDAATCLSLAIRLSHILVDIHRAGVLHRHVNPCTIAIQGPGSEPILTDFSLATLLTQSRPEPIHTLNIAGDLAYLAPEQSGRTGYVIDERTDLYGLGATLYHAATGRPPFLSRDPLKLMHEHLSRVPMPPIELNPGISRGLSDIILRLLEKEPDQRYQSAEGLLHDLTKLREQQARGETSPFALGERDFPVRLAGPSRLIGRAEELATLRRAFDDALYTSNRGIFVSGAPGVGKTTLINALRPVVAGAGGWFVSGKFDQYRRGESADGVWQALRALGRRLLAEPEEALAQHRARLEQALGPNVGLAARLPEFARLLGVEPEAVHEEPRIELAQLAQAGLDLLSAIASPTQPVVLMLDDLQWAGRAQLDFIDFLLSAPWLRGLLIVGAYRDEDVDEKHPLAVSLSRWRHLGLAPPPLALRNLPPSDLCQLLGTMLRLPAEAASTLSQDLSTRTAGNPYDTIELVNALRGEGLLSPRGGGWTWDKAAIHHYVGDRGVVDLLGKRLEKLPADSRAVLQSMACLGGEIRRRALSQACGMDAQAIDAAMTPAIEAGLLTRSMGPGSEEGGNEPLTHDISYTFRHDRVQQAAVECLAPSQRRELQLQMARRLVVDQRSDDPSSRPGANMSALAAEQYLAVADMLDEPAECQRVLTLFQGAASRARVVHEAIAERFLSAALALLEHLTMPADISLRRELEIERHVSLHGLARFEEADALYTTIVGHCDDPLQLVEAAGVQISGLNVRGRRREATALGLALLSQFGLDLPDNLASAVKAGTIEATQWVFGEDKALDFHRPEANDPRVLAKAQLLSKTATAAFFYDQALGAWLTLESLRLWRSQGPCPPLASGLRSLPMVLASARNYTGTYVAAKHLLAVSEKRGYAVAAAIARFTFGLCAQHWFEPLEATLPLAVKTREELLQAGDLQYVAFTYTITSPVILECAASLDEFDEEIEAAMTFLMRTGNHNTQVSLLPSRQLLRVLRGQTQTPGQFVDAEFDETPYQDSSRIPPTIQARHHIVRAIAAAVFGDMSSLAQHTQAVWPLLKFSPGFSYVAVGYVLHSLSRADQVRTQEGEARQTALAELDRSMEWLAQRAADAPDNFQHLLHWIQAERAWALGDFQAAASAFDTALAAVRQHVRPWHHALITERAGLFYLAHGMTIVAGSLLTRACRLYRDWGATGKVSQLEQVHAELRLQPDTEPSLAESTSMQQSAVTNDAIDLMAILRASQALSSETSLTHLRTRVSEVLQAMTGATAVTVVLWREDTQGWCVTAPHGHETLNVDQAGARGLLPITAFRYAERTREALVIDDATTDDRFAADPYFLRLTRCSMLVAPIFSQGTARAMLLLENRLSRGAFSASRLDAVMLIAGQLAASLDNAMLYASLERQVSERTEKLTAQTHMLEEQAHALAQARAAADAANAAKSQFLAHMSHEIRTPLNGVIGMNALMLRSTLTSSQQKFAQAIQVSADSLLSIVNDILDISKLEAGKVELEDIAFDLEKEVEDVVELLSPRAAEKSLALLCHLDEGARLPLRGDPGRLRQIILNLLSNALKFTEAGHVAIDVSSRQVESGRMALRMDVSDTGSGISAEAKAKLFQNFQQADNSITRRYGGTGLGLAICHQLITLMGGSIDVMDRPGGGSIFRVELRLRPCATTQSASQQQMAQQRVLLLDSLDLRRAILARQLNEQGANVTQASSESAGHEAMGQAHEEGLVFDVIMIDDTLPFASVQALAQSVRSHPAGRSACLVLATASMDSTQHHNLTANFDVVLSKPIRRQTLLEALKPSPNSFQPSAPAMNQTPSAPSPQPQGQHAPRILLAEDNAINTELATTLLTGAGYEVDCVETGVDALNAAQTGRYALILMDVHMPGMGGLEATSRIRALGGSASTVPIVAMTGAAMAHEQAACLQAGMNAFVTKPIDIHEFLRVTAHWVDASEQAPPA